ncbi:short-chain dehydrogenase [Xylariaceae sp. FL0016]|nr:short-chain dehydrogenase [Xylariaceae sp. FL0016]
MSTTQGQSTPHPFPLQGRYASHYKPENLAGPGDSRPTAQQIVEDEHRVGDMKDKVFFLTGCASSYGSGIHIVSALASTGATIYASARNLAAARETLAPWVQTGQVVLLHMDQTDLQSVRDCAAQFKKLREGSRNKLNVLLANAGIMNTPEARTRDGFESQLGVNYLSHWVLFRALRHELAASSTPAFQSRVVCVSSVAHRGARIHWDNLSLAGGAYEGWAAYGQSELAVTYMANQVGRRYAARGVHANSLMPGGWVSPNLQKHSEEFVAMLKNPDLMRFMYSPEQGAATPVYAAISRELEGKGGFYLEGAGIAGPAPKNATLADYGYDYDVGQCREDEERLWEVTKGLVGGQ